MFSLGEPQVSLLVSKQFGEKTVIEITESEVFITSCKFLFVFGSYHTLLSHSQYKTPVFLVADICFTYSCSIGIMQFNKVVYTTLSHLV